MAWAPAHGLGEVAKPHGQTVDDPGSAKPSGRSAWATIALLSLVFALAMIDRVVLATVVGPAKVDLGLSDTAFGMAQGLAPALFYVAFAIPCGWAADRYDRRLILILGLLVWSVASASCALVTNFTSLFIARAFVGMGESALGPAGYPLVGALVAKRRVPLAMMLVVLGMVSGNGLGLLIGGPLLEWLSTTVGAIRLGPLGVLASWRLVFIITGLPGPFLAVLLWFNLGRNAAVREDKMAVASKPLKLEQFVKRHAKFYTGYIAGVGLQLAGMFAVTMWNGAYMMRRFHWRADQVGIVFGSALLACSVVGLLFHSWIVARLFARGRRDIYVSWQILVSACAVPALLLAYVSGSPYGVIAGFALFNLCVGGVLAAGPTGLQLATPKPFQGRIMAIYVMVSSLVGAAAGPALVGVVTDHVFGSESQVGAAILACTLFFNIAAIACFWFSKAAAGRLIAEIST